jgi:predicted nucleic acid-binding protein
MKIYMDACCLNRPFDDQRQLRIRLESEAIMIMLEKFQNGEWVWLGSEVLLYELRQNPDVEKRHRTLALAQMAHEHIVLTDEILQCAERLKEAGFDVYDAAHLACAEAGAADVFLTTDDRIVKAVRRSKGLLNVHVDNPIRWLEKVLR